MGQRWPTERVQAGGHQRPDLAGIDFQLRDGLDRPCEQLVLGPGRAALERALEGCRGQAEASGSDCGAPKHPLGELVALEPEQRERVLLRQRGAGPGHRQAADPRLVH